MEGAGETRSERIVTFIDGMLTDIEQFHDREAEESAVVDTITSWVRSGWMSPDEGAELYNDWLHKHYPGV